MKNLLLSILAFASLSAMSQNGLNFDGVDDYVHTSFEGISGAQPRTIEAWINTTTATAEAHYITDYGYFGAGSWDNGKRFTLLLNPAHQFRVEIRGWGLNATTPLNDGNWHHVAATYDGTTVRLYVDGVEEASGNPSITVNTTLTTDFLIGSRTDLLDLKMFEGSIDEVRFWDVARTEEEINATSNIEFCFPPANLVAYYKLNEGTAEGNNAAETTAYDASGNMNDGILNDFALTGISSNWVGGEAFLSSVTNNQSFNECDGFSITVGTNTYNTTGTYTDVLTSVLNGCDSTVITDLTITDPQYVNNTYNECSGFSITVGMNTYNTTGIYVDSLTSVVSGCDSIITTDLTIHETDNTVSVTGITITANLAGANYTWIDCDNGNMVISGETDQSFEPTANGNYAVIVDDAVCVDTSDCVSIASIGMYESEFTQIEIYPNPTADMLTVKTSQNATGQIIIKNLLGEVVLTNYSTSTSQNIDVSELPTGTYFIVIAGGNGTITKKFVKL